MATATGGAPDDVPAGRGGHQARGFGAILRTLMARLAARDAATAGHCARVARYARAVASRRGLPPAVALATHYAGLLHDYGKIGVDHSVLSKPGRLTPEERRHVRTHARLTWDLLGRLPLPDALADLPLLAAAHHERWDGGGYPFGLEGEAIPVAARIVTLADVFDSLTAARPYRQAIGVEQALGILEEGRDSAYGGEDLDAFMAWAREVEGPRREERRRRAP